MVNMKTQKKLPDTIRVGYQDIKITAVDMGDDYGRYNSQTARIDYDPDRNKREVVNTIIHEVLHAISHTQGLRVITFKNEELEENIINSFANGFTQVFLDNPALLDWIAENLHNA